MLGGNSIAGLFSTWRDGTRQFFDFSKATRDELIAHIFELQKINPHLTIDEIIVLHNMVISSLKLDISPIDPEEVAH